MRKALVLFLLTAAFFVCCGAPCVADKVTADPNAPGIKATADSPGAKTEADARLDQRVTYEARHKTVLAILADLSKKTGIDLRAGQNSKDWPARDCKMNLFVTNLPLRDLMASMARVLKFKWSRENVGKYLVYRFYMPHNTQAEAEDLRKRDEEERKQRLGEKRSRTLAVYAQAADLSPEDLAKLKDKSPYLYAIARTGLARDIMQFLAGCSRADEALRDGRAADISAGDLSPDARQALTRAVRSRRQVWAGLAVPLADDPANTIAYVRINPDTSRIAPSSEPAYIEVHWGDRDHDDNDLVSGVNIIDPESASAQVMGRGFIKGEEEGKPVDEVIPRGERAEAFYTDAKKDEPGAEPATHPDEPDLHKDIALKLEKPQLLNIEAALSKEAEMTVVGDSFDTGRHLSALPSGQTELKDLLEKIGDASGCDWEKHGSVIEFRDRRWYQKRAAMIPEAWLESWRATLKRTSTLDIADLAQIASLTQDQMSANITPDQILGKCGLGAMGHDQYILRLFAVLDETQQKALLSGVGLDLRKLLSEQWAIAEKFINWRNPAVLTDPNAKLILTCKRTAWAKQFVYTFTINRGGDLLPLEWGLKTPFYEPPKEQSKPDEKQRTPAK